MDVKTLEKKYWYHLCIDEQGSIMSSVSRIPDKIITDVQRKREEGCISFHPSWRDAVAEGIVADRAGYLSLLRDLSIGLVVRELADNSDKDEASLIHLVRILDEADRSLSKLSEKIEDYYIALHPAELAGYQRNIRSLIDTLTKTTEDPLNRMAKDLQRLQETRTTLAHDIGRLAEKILPNMSALCGPLVSARLLAKAGSKQHLARMPASSLQVFGAGSSLFVHLTAGTNPPKHGIIYQYKGIHHAKRRFRGRVSRVVACQLGIAAKIDLYRGVSDEIFIKKAGERICRAGKET